MTANSKTIDAIVAAGTLLQPDPNGGFTARQDAAIAVNQGMIQDVGPRARILADYAAREVTDEPTGAVVPSFVNCHVHTCQQLARGLADDVPVGPWLDRVVSFEAAMDEEAVAASVRLACLEMIRNGTAGFVEACANPLYVDVVAEQFAASGLRAVLTRSVVQHREDDWSAPSRFMESADDSIRATERMIERWDGAGDGRIRAWVGWRHQQDVSDDLLKRLGELARDADVGIHSHMATREWGELERLASLDMLERRYIFAHGIHYTERDLALLRNHDLSVSHNPGASMHGAYGSSARGRFPEMLARGVRVCLGSDAAANNNVLDMTRETRLFATLHKETRADASIVHPAEALTAATTNGYHACGWYDGQLLTHGAPADLNVIDPTGPHMVPTHRLLSNIVYCMNGVDVKHSMVDGRWLLRDRRCQTMDEASVIDDARAAAERVATTWQAEYGHAIAPDRDAEQSLDVRTPVKAR